MAVLVTCSACSRPRPQAEIPRALPFDAGTPSEQTESVEPGLHVPEETAAPAGEACMSSATCGAGQQCRGAPGCGTGWACGAARECLSETVAYCDCEGSTIYAPGGCPGRPYAHLGPCGRLGEVVASGTELGLPDWDEQPTSEDRICESNADCGRLETCLGIAGCATEWRCVRARGCSRERVSFCGCDGESFVASATCPGRPFVHRGECRGEALARGEPARLDAGVSAMRSLDAGTPPLARSAARPGVDAGVPTPARTPTPIIDGGTPRIATTAVAPGARVCQTNRDCPRSEICQGPPGCGMQFTCAPPERECIRDTQVFCDCAGRDFRASMFCPGRPYAHRGSCEIDRLMDLSGAAVR